MSTTAAGFAERLASVRERIGTAGGDPAAVTVVAVTKGFGSDAVQASIDAGVADVGENYAQELLAKADAVGEGQAALEGRVVRWHFLGTPQRNKIGRLAPIVSLWQGMDREAALDRLAAVRPQAAVLIQVNVVGDPGKGGCDIEDVGRLVDHGRSVGLDVRGLMTVGPAGDIEGSSKTFASLARMAADHDLGELSMGMSDDFEAAVAEGATMIRLGRVLFGPRPVVENARR